MCRIGWGGVGVGVLRGCGGRWVWMGCGWGVDGLGWVGLWMGAWWWKLGLWAVGRWIDSRVPWGGSVMACDGSDGGGVIQSLPCNVCPFTPTPHTHIPTGRQEDSQWRATTTWDRRRPPCRPRRRRPRPRRSSSSSRAGPVCGPPRRPRCGLLGWTYMRETMAVVGLSTEVERMD